MKIGLYFGSFNPIHIGHLAIANYIAEFSDLDEIWFVISPQNPFKQKKNLLADYHRLELVNRAIEDYPKFRSSTIEFGLPQPSYTIHTLSYLQEKHPDKKFALIMGSDNLVTFSKWKNYELILKDYELYVYPRPGFSSDEIKLNGTIHLLDAPLMEVSSSFIRKAIKEQKEIPYFLPPETYKYLKEMHFYKH